jgi:hypothetical protein
MADVAIPSLSIADWLPDRLKDAVVRYGWAAKHVLQLNDVLREFEDEPSWELEQSPDLSAGMVRIRILREPPRDIGLIVGDIVHSLRASLDYATCALIKIQDEAAQIDRIQFPFCRPGIAMNSSERKPFVCISEIGLAHIEEARRIGHPYLGVLNRASNQDKHRSIATVLHRQMPMKVVVDSEANTADIVPDADRIDVWSRPLSNGDVVEMGNIFALRTGFVVEGDDAPYALAVVNQLFNATHQSLCLMMVAAKSMLTMKGA